MCIIAVSEEAFSGGREFAETLAKRLGMRYVDAAVLVERAAARGADQKELRATLESAPNFLDRFTRHRCTLFVLLQAALGEEIREGNAVCYGVASDLLNLEAGQILRIRVEASHRFRRSEVQERLGLRGDEAERHLRKCDRNQRRWHLYLYGTKIESVFPRDLAVNFEQTSLDEGCATVLDLISRQRRFTPGAAGLASVERFAASTRIKAALAEDPETSHLDIDVEVRDDRASLRGMVHCFPEIADVKRVALSAAAGRIVDVSEVVLGGQEYAPVFFSDPLVEPLPASQRAFWAPALSWAGGLFAFVSAAILIFALTPAGSWVARRGVTPVGARLQSFAGVITDSHCGLSYNKSVALTADCVRSCVKEAGAKYVLSDGTHLYALSDQQSGERFAAQRVVATGVVDPGSGALRLRSIQGATP